MGGSRRVFVGVVVLLISACATEPATQATAEPTTGTADPLRVAVVTFEPGSAEFGGLSRAQAVEQAITDVNAAGGVLGRPVELTVRYSGRTGERVGQAVTEALEEDGAAAVIGPDNSAETLQVLDQVVAAPAVMCGPNATADELSAYEDDDYYFRTAPPDRHQGPVLADLIAERGLEPVTVFVQGGAYGEGLAASLTSGLEDQGVEFTEIVFSPTAEDRAEVERALVESDPGSVAVLSYIGPVLGGLSQLGLGPQDLPVFVSDGLAIDEVFQHIDPSDPAVTEGMLGVRPGHDADHPDQDLVDRVATGHFTAQAYDCAVLIALAAEAAGSVEPDAIRDQMAEVSRDGERCTTFAACAPLVRDGVDIDYDGPSGRIELDEAGDPSVAVYHVLEFQADGRMSVIDRVHLP